MPDAAGGAAGTGAFGVAGFPTHLAWTFAMDNEAATGSGACAPSRLLIHAAGDDGCDGWTVAAVIQRMRLQVLDGPRGGRPPLALEIHDLLGHRMLTLSDARRLVDIVLSPGTYHVTTDLAGTRRRYTVALEQGVSVDLYLRSRAVDRH
jgi:hypothetical protein